MNIAEIYSIVVNARLSDRSLREHREASFRRSSNKANALTPEKSHPLFWINRRR